MKDKNIKTISSKISRQFPEVAGSQPKVQRQTSKSSKSSNPTYLLTYRGKAKTADGKSINRVVRVTADESGKIIKITTSR
jgi:predicted lipoprotein